MGPETVWLLIFFYMEVNGTRNCLVTDILLYGRQWDQKLSGYWYSSKIRKSSEWIWKW